MAHLPPAPAASIFLRRSMFTAADYSYASLLLSVAGTSPVNVHSVVRSNSLTFLRQVCILLLDCLLLFRGTLPGARALVRWIRLRINAHKLTALAIAGGSPEGVLPMKRLDCRRTWVFFQTRHLQLTARSSDCRHFTFACFRQYNEADGFVTSRRCCYACNTLIIVTLIIVIIVTLGFRL